MTMRAPTTRVREGIGLFAMDDRGLLEVRGSDRVRWLDGMLTADVKKLEARGDGAGAPALFLTHRGAIVADFHVGRLGDALLLECLRSELPRIRAALEKRIIADDVVLADRGDREAVIGVEGARAGDVVACALAAGGAAAPGPDQWAVGGIAGAQVLLAGFGWSGERAVQIRVESAARAAVHAALVAAAGALGVDCGEGDRALLEVLRIESGIPALGAELDEDVLPPEARLERSIAVNKGCYVGQEIVARLRSRGQVNHLLVGLRREGSDAFVPGTALSAAGRATGEITSAAVSPTEGPIALAFVRREHAEPDSLVELASGGSARVVALPFVPSASTPLASASAAGAPTPGS
ncbi:MAG: glycine cleavage T C-terminal barrel domain-containing protein [Myxococcota bacterium]